jgi:hypothetical protein
LYLRINNWKQLIEEIGKKLRKRKWKEFDKKTERKLEEKAIEEE